MKKPRKAARLPQIVLDRDSEKRQRGRPAQMRASEIYGRAENYRAQFWQTRWDKRKKQAVRDHPWPWAEQMLAAINEDELRKALESAPGYVQSQFANIIPLIVSIYHEKKFPKSVPTQLDYLADSLGGHGTVSARRSRDVCGIERAKTRCAARFKIIRYEYYVECSCGYKGPARDGACRKCGAVVPVSSDALFG